MKNEKNQNLKLSKSKIGIIILAILIIIFFIIFMQKRTTNHTIPNMESEIQQSAIDFYENKYYPSIPNNNASSLEKFKDTGIKISLTDLINIIPISSQAQEELQQKKCNYDNSKVTIYPKSPYQIKDYEIKIELSCSE